MKKSSQLIPMSAVRFANEHEMGECLRKEEAKYKGDYTRTRTKILMTLEEALSSKKQVIEHLSLLSAAFEDVVRAVESLEAHYDAVGDSSMAKDFSEIERTVGGIFQQQRLSQSGALSVSRTVLAGKFAVKEQSERLE